MNAFGQFLIEVFGDSLQDAAEIPFTAVWRELRRRLTGYHVAASWTGALASMLASWKYGVMGPPTWLDGILVAVFIFGPVVALVFTIAWLERRGA